MSDMPDEWRVTPRVHPVIAFVLRLLLVLAVAALVVGYVAISLEIERARILWQVNR